MPRTTRPTIAAALGAPTPFALRCSANAPSDIEIVGDAVLTRPATAAECAAVQDGAAVGQDNGFGMGLVDVDGDAATFKSSRAGLALPRGARVVSRRLVWTTPRLAPGARRNVCFTVPLIGSNGTVRRPRALAQASQRPPRHRRGAHPAEGSGPHPALQRRLDEQSLGAGAPVGASTRDARVMGSEAAPLKASRSVPEPSAGGPSQVVSARRAAVAVGAPSIGRPAPARCPEPEVRMRPGTAHAIADSGH